MKYIITILLIFFSNFIAVSNINNENEVHISEIEICTKKFHPIEKLIIKEVDGTIIDAVNNYREYFNYISELTNYPVEFIAGIWGLETGNGTSKLWIKNLNPSGVVSTSHNPFQSSSVYSSDDGGSNKASFDNLKNSAEGWAYVLNLTRYRECLSVKNNIPNLVSCFYTNGYHTDNNLNSRINTILAYKAVLELI